MFYSQQANRQGKKINKVKKYKNFKKTIDFINVLVYYESWIGINFKYD